MKVIDINKYIKTFSDKETGTVTAKDLIFEILEPKQESYYDP